MNQCVNSDFNLVLIGDFNVYMLKKNKDFKDCLDVNGLSNIVKKATCFKGVPSLIDLIITNRPKRFKNTVSVETGLSDFHSLVCTSTKFHIPKQKAITFTYRSYKHFNKIIFLRDLSAIPYHISECFDDVDDAYYVWNELTMQVVNEHAPVKCKTIKGTRVPYMNGELRRAINVRNMFKRKYDKCKSTGHWQQYRNQRNLVTKLRKKSMNIFLRSKCSTTSGSGKEFWETVKPLISNKYINKNDNIILLTNGNVVTHQDKVATVFNDYFTNMAKDIGSDDCINVYDNVPSCVTKHDQHDSVKNIKHFMETFGEHVDFDFHDVSIGVVKSHLCNLKNK